MKELLSFVLSLSVIVAADLRAQHDHGPADSPDSIGSASVQFSTSCAASVKDDFNRAVALLHSFWFAQAIEALDWSFFTAEADITSNSWGATAGCTSSSIPVMEKVRILTDLGMLSVFAAGNNQESSSEGMHFAAATAHFGALTGDEELRDLGVYLHTTQASTVARYWQNADGDTFPENYPEDVVGMVWGDGGDYRIWWDGGHEEHYGINYLPITAGSLYLGYDPEHAGAMYESLVAKLGGEPDIWRDIHWAHRALSDGDDALRMFEEQWDTYEPEAGGSKPHTYQWVSTLAELGTVDVSVTADTAHYAVFDNGGTTTYTAFNPGQSALTVSFSDGTSLEVPAGELAVTSG